MHLRFCLAWVWLAMGTAGCGLLEIERTIFPEQAVNPNGDLLYFEDLTDVTENDAFLDLTKEVTLENNLGINNPALIDALVIDGLGDVDSIFTPIDGDVVDDDVDDTADDTGEDDDPNVINLSVGS